MSRPRKLSHFLAVFITLILVFHTRGAVCEEQENVHAARDEALSKLGRPLESLRIRELQALLNERGVECRACTEKHDLIERVTETIHLPVKETPPEDTGDAPDVEELLRRLKNTPGGEGLNFQTFDRNNIEEMIKQMERERGAGEGAAEEHTEL